MKNTVIIGNGISGVTLARFMRKKCNDPITIISSETEHFFSRTALMYIYMGHMPFENTKPYEDWFWKKNRIDLVFDHVNEVDFDSKKLVLQSGNTLTYHQLVFAVGSKPNFYGWPGQNLQGVQGLFSFQDLQKMEQNTKGIKQAIVTGGGLIGIEMVEMLASRGIPVTYLVREFKFWTKVLPNEEADMVGNHIKEHHIDLRLNDEVTEFIGDSVGKVSAVKTKNGETISCDFAGVCVGVSPNIDFLKKSNLKTDRGILVNNYFETNIENVYAIGDCAQFEQPLKWRLPLEQIWYTGRMHGETLAHTLAGKRTAYQPGNFFNSAKLFDIEYQIYSRGFVIPEEATSLLYINHKEKKSIRIYFNENSGLFEGVSLLGIRYRHEVCDRWLTENRSIEYVLEHLSDANFDPEFYKTYEEELIQLYNKKFNKSISLRKKNWKRILGLNK